MSKMVYFNVNSHTIKQNRKHGTRHAPIRMTIGRRGKPSYGEEFTILTPKSVRIVYNPDQPLSCGATVWVEVEPSGSSDLLHVPSDTEQSGA